MSLCIREFLWGLNKYDSRLKKITLNCTIGPILELSAGRPNKDLIWERTFSSAEGSSIGNLYRTHRIKNLLNSKHISSFGRLYWYRGVTRYYCRAGFFGSKCDFSVQISPLDGWLVFALSIPIGEKGTVTLVTLKVPSGQIGSAWEWCHWKAL